MLKKTWNRDRDPWIGQAVKTINTIACRALWRDFEKELQMLQFLYKSCILRSLNCVILVSES